MTQYFSYCDGDFQTHETAEEAKETAEECLSYFRDVAGEGWSDESMNICWGEVRQHVEVTMERPVEPGDCVAKYIDTWQERQLRDA